MTDNIRTNFCATCKESADRIEALTLENQELRSENEELQKELGAQYFRGYYEGRVEGADARVVAAHAILEE